MKVERLITVFDNSTERLLEEINIDSIDLEELKNIFNVPYNDPMMFNVYEIGPDQIRATNRLLKKK